MTSAQIEQIRMQLQSHVHVRYPEDSVIACSGKICTVNNIISVIISAHDLGQIEVKYQSEFSFNFRFEFDFMKKERNGILGKQVAKGGGIGKLIFLGDGEGFKLKGFDDFFIKEVNNT